MLCTEKGLSAVSMRIPPAKQSTQMYLTTINIWRLSFAPCAFPCSHPCLHPLKPPGKCLLILRAFIGAIGQHDVMRAVQIRIIKITRGRRTDCPLPDKGRTTISSENWKSDPLGARKVADLYHLYHSGNTKELQNRTKLCWWPTARDFKNTTKNPYITFLLMYSFKRLVRSPAALCCWRCQKPTSSSVQVSSLLPLCIFSKHSYLDLAEPLWFLHTYFAA